MKKLIIFVGFLLASMQVMAFEIPVENCSQEIPNGGGAFALVTNIRSNPSADYYPYFEVMNAYTVVRNGGQYKSTRPLNIICTSPVQKGYGTKLEVEVGYINSSSFEPISCHAISYRGLQAIEATGVKSTGLNQQGYMKFSVTASTDDDAEVVRVFCTIPQTDYDSQNPPRGGISTGNSALSDYAKENGSGIFSIRVY